MGTLRERLEADGWDVPHDTRLDGEPVDMEITSGEQLRTLTDGFRMRLLAALARRPGSAKQLAARFDVPTTRLYHHLDMLEEQGFIEVVATRRSGARTERCYGVPPRGSMRPGKALLEADGRGDLATSMRALAELVGTTLEQAVLQERLDLSAVGSDEGLDVVSWSTLRLTDDQRAAFSAELAGLIGRMVDDAKANEGADTPTTPVTAYFVVAPDPLAPSD